MRLTTLFLLMFSLACGGSGGGSGDDEDTLTLSNMRASIDADADERLLCNLDGFEEGYTYVADYDGDLEVGDRAFERLTFLPSGASNSVDFVLGRAGAGSGIAPGEVGAKGCYTSDTDTQIEIEFYIITTDGVRSNTVSDTFNI